MSSALPLYAYGIMWCAGDVPALAVPSAEAEPVEPSLRAVRHCGLAAIVSALTQDPESGLPPEQMLSRAESAKAMVITHYRVLRALLDHHTVVPLRFGTVFTDEAAVTTMLARHYDVLGRALDRVEGVWEWGVKVFCDRAALVAHVAAQSKTIGAARARLDRTSEGAGFFARKRLQRVVDAEADAAILRCVNQSHDRFAAVAREATTIDPQPPAAHGRTGEMVFSGAYLVERGREKSLFAAIDAAFTCHASLGIRYEHTGPWPPFSFCNGAISATA